MRSRQVVQDGPDEPVLRVGLPGKDLVLAALDHVDLDVGSVNQILERGFHTVLENVQNIFHVWIIFRDVKEPGK